jgi:hypothetical protein
MQDTPLPRYRCYGNRPINTPPPLHHGDVAEERLCCYQGILRFLCSNKELLIALPATPVNMATRQQESKAFSVVWLKDYKRTALPRESVEL